MKRVLVVFASRHGGTHGIAARIGEVLHEQGLSTHVLAPSEVADVATVDAFVIGSGVYMGSWLKEGIDFIERHQETLATRPVWLFSSGPLRGSTMEKADVDPFESALGPADGPGSGGRKKITELGEAIHTREHKVFFGAYDPNDPPRALSERFVRMMPAAKDMLPEGDFRDWPEVEAWAREIARALVGEPVGVA